MQKLTAAVLTMVLFLAPNLRAESAPTPPALTLHTLDNLKAGKPQVIVTYGTSLTAGGAWVAGLDAALTQRFGKASKVVNCGMSGKNSDDGVKQIQTVLQANPNLVFVEFGMNDAVLRFNISVEDARANLEKIIEKLRAQNPAVEIILMTMNPPVGKEREGKRPEIEKYYQMYRDTAQKLKLPLIDHYAAWQKLLTDDPKKFNALVPDGLHPNAEGSTTITLPAVKHALGL